jgi:hypothetical protein
VPAQNKQTNNMQHTTQHTPNTRFAATLFATLLLGIIMFMGLGAKGQAPWNHYNAIRFDNQTNEDVTFYFKTLKDGCDHFCDVGNSGLITAGGMSILPVSPTNFNADPLSCSAAQMSNLNNWQHQGIAVMVANGQSYSPNMYSVWSAAGGCYFEGDDITYVTINGTTYTLIIYPPVSNGLQVVLPVTLY